MIPTTGLMQHLALKTPVIQAPMAGGGDTPALIAAVAEAGGLGFLGAAYLTLEQIEAAGREIRGRTNRPFGVNLFAPLPVAELPSEPAPAVEQVARFYAEMGLPAPSTPPPPEDDFEARLAAALETGATLLSFTFGLLPEAAVAECKRRGLYLIGTATTVEEGRRLQDSGVDAVVAQGAEAGGHRGSLASDELEAGLIGTLALVPQMVDALDLPVIASGGIMDGRGIAAALALGAQAVQMGTAFLTTAEAGVAPAYKQAILAAQAHQTRITRAFSGRPARGIVNRFLTEVEATGAILPFPYQNALTRPLRAAAGKQGRAEFLSLWAGQGLGLARPEPAAELMQRLASETEAVLARLVGPGDG